MTVGRCNVWMTITYNKSSHIFVKKKPRIYEYIRLWISTEYEYEFVFEYKIFVHKYSNILIYSNIRHTLFLLWLSLQPRLSSVEVFFFEDVFMLPSVQIIFFWGCLLMVWPISPPFFWIYSFLHFGKTELKQNKFPLPSFVCVHLSSELSSNIFFSLFHYVCIPWRLSSVVFCCRCILSKK